MALVMKPREEWIPDNAAKHCMQCRAGPFSRVFGLTRHHCRACGQVVCKNCSARRHPTYTDFRICSRCYSRVIVAENKLQTAGWYHGSLNRQAAESRLMLTKARFGDYLVRESASVDGFIALSVKTQTGQILHYLIREAFGRWYIGSQPNSPEDPRLYASIQSLITEEKNEYNLIRGMIVEGFTGSTCPRCDATVNDSMEFCEEQIYDDDDGGGIYDDEMGPSGAAVGGIYDDDGAGFSEGIYDDTNPTSGLGAQSAQLLPVQPNSETLGKSTCCTGCGYAVKTGSTFCPECGTRIE